MQTSFGVMSFHKVTSYSKTTKNVFFGKMLYPVLSIINKEIVDTSKGIIRFEAQIGTNDFTISEIHYAWNLPPGVRVVTGDVEGDLLQLKPGAEVTIQIEAIGYDLEKNENTILMLYHNKGSSRLGNSFVVPSRDDLTNEYKVLPKAEMENSEASKITSVSKMRSISSVGAVNKFKGKINY